jgi:hypothetical protein
LGRNGKIVVALMAVLAVFLGAVFYMGAKRDAAQTAEATAIVVKAERERQRGDDNTILTVAYSASGTVAQARARLDRVRMHEFPAGRRVRICYDPNDLESVRVEDGACG